MKVKNMIWKRVLVTVVVSIIILASCSKNNEVLNSTDVENINSELLSEACMAEASEMSVVLFSNVNDSKLGSLSSSIPDLSSIDSPLNVATLSISGAGGMNDPQGIITIDFGKGTTDHHGVLRKGIVKITYSGRRWAAGSSHTISFSGYSRNNVRLDDSTNYTITNVTDSLAISRDFYHVLRGCKLTFPDMKAFLRNAEFISTIDFVAKTTTLNTIDTIINNATGTTRYGADFDMKIINPIIYNSQCIGSKIDLPIGGTKSITVGSSTYTIAYGSAKTCGQTVKVIVGDKSTVITVNSDGN